MCLKILSRVEKSNSAALLSLSQELDNAELLSSLLRMIYPESPDLEQAILLLRLGNDLRAGFSDRFGNLRDYVVLCEGRILDRPGGKFLIPPTESEQMSQSQSSSTMMVVQK